MSLHIARVVPAVAVALVVGGHAVAQEAQLFSEDGSGIVELSGHSRLVIDRIPGEIRLRVGKSGELRYMARSLEQRREQRPVALWLKGRSMALRPVEGGEEEPLLLEIAVSPGVAVELDLMKSRLSVSGIQGSVKIRARETDIDVRGLDGDLDLDLQGGLAVVNGVSGALDVEVDHVDTTLARVEGPVTISARESRVELTEALEEVEIDADGGTVTVTTVGRFDALVREGELRLSDARIGAGLRLESANLHVANSRGDIRVDSDGAVVCENLKGPLVVTGFGADVRGTKIVGSVEVVTDHASVELKEIEGRTRVQGTNLKVDVDQVKGEVSIDIQSSNLTVNRAEGPVVIQAEFGEISILQATGAVTIDSREGDVHVLNLAGPLQLKAHGNRVDVLWATLEGETKQSVENGKGDVWLSFPASAQGTIQASAPDGRIESSVADVQVSDDATSASGNLGGGLRPLVRITSAGDVHLKTHAAPYRPPETKAKIGTGKLQPDQ